jgi:hypothetical protein
MAAIGKINKLKVIKKVDFGVYLDGENLGEILLPRKGVPENCAINDMVKIFIYHDSQDRIIATTKTPFAMVGEFAFLKTVSVTKVGAFLDWGLEKDLLVPFAEQQIPLIAGRFYTVFVYLDKSSRIVASTKLDKYFADQTGNFSEGEEVELLIYRRTDLGFNAIINNSVSGVLYDNEIFQELKEGLKLKGYIKKIREDQKIDLSLIKPGYEKVDDLLAKIVDLLNKESGFIPITDKSSPDIIYKMFGVSKKTFKKAIGALYKKKVIQLAENGIKLIGIFP